ncbi:MAG: VOC family protein [Candidatus Izimaplasma sp.]|nr:VOC family protein [Candidatus Izimaplasma bacterium]
MKPLKGIHHITAITSSAEKIYAFFTYTLGLRLVKKTINQDDINTYHLFFADDIGSPGTDMTFFDFQGINKGEKGSNEIGRIGFRVKSDQAIEYWLKRLDYYGIKYEYNENLFNRKMIFFEDFDNQEYAIVSDENIKGVSPGIPWKKGPVPNEYAITGLGPIFIRVNDKEKIDNILRNYLIFRKKASSENLTLYEVGEGGNGASIIVDYKPNLKPAIQGYGSVHHMAFRIEDEKALNQWIIKLNNLGARHSGLVDRFYFKSLYTRLYPKILFEFATEGPGFIDDEEKYETLGDKLALPPNFRNKRNYIEKAIRHIDTDRSKIIFQKEYLNE